MMLNSSGESIDTTMENCAECGAQGTAGLSCQVVFDECLAKEFADPGFGAVHHLTVTAYMLQHSSKLTREGWLEMRQLMREFLVNNIAPSEIRRKNRSVVDNGKRTWKISSRDHLPIIAGKQWSKTVLGVRDAVCLENAEQYCTDVTAWAKAVLVDAEQVILP